jgi:hypothetical protein
MDITQSIHQLIFLLALNIHYVNCLILLIEIFNLKMNTCYIQNMQFENYFVLFFAFSKSIYLKKIILGQYYICPLSLTALQSIISIFIE